MKCMCLKLGVGIQQKKLGDWWVHNTWKDMVGFSASNNNINIILFYFFNFALGM